MEKPELKDTSITLASVQELPEAGKALLHYCGNRKVVAFYGEMGAGKTTFIREICHQLGVDENVSSPTFSLINEYHSNTNGRIFHFDLYRLNKPEEAEQLGLGDYFYSGNWCFIEWPEKILNLLPENRVEVRIHTQGFTRKISFSHV